MIRTGICQHCGKIYGDHYGENCHASYPTSEFLDSGLFRLQQHSEELYGANKTLFDFLAKYHDNILTWPEFKQLENILKKINPELK